MSTTDWHTTACIPCGNICGIEVRIDGTARRTRFDEAHRPVARAADLIGDRWTPLVLRELPLGRTRRNDIQIRTETSRAVLSERPKRIPRFATRPRGSLRAGPSGCAPARGQHGERTGP